MSKRRISALSIAAIAASVVSLSLALYVYVAPIVREITRAMGGN